MFSKRSLELLRLQQPNWLFLAQWRRSHKNEKWGRSETEKFNLGDLFSSVLSQLKKNHPSRNLECNNLGIFQSLKLRILIEKNPSDFSWPFPSKNFGRLWVKENDNSRTSNPIALKFSRYLYLLGDKVCRFWSRSGLLLSLMGDFL